MLLFALSGIMKNYKNRIPDYEKYLKQHDHYIRKHLVLNETNLEYVTVYNGKIGSSNTIVDVTCPMNEIVSIKGEHEPKSDYKLKLDLFDDEGTALFPFTAIMIAHDTSSERVDIPARVYYADISGKKDKRQYFSFAYNIELNAGDHLRFYIVGSNPANGFPIPNISISKSKIKFELECDILRHEL